MIKCVGDPVKFVKRYNDAVRADGSSFSFGEEIVDSIPFTVIENIKRGYER